MTDAIYNELRTIRSRIESIEKTQEVLVRAEADRILAGLLPIFRADLAMAKVYLAVDGRKGQRDIGTEIGVSEATVSRKIEKLRELDLVELVDRTASGNIYARTTIDRLLRLSRRVRAVIAEAAG